MPSERPKLKRAQSGVARPKTAAERRARTAQILAGLDEMYPGVTCALEHSSSWELLVATILSAQCTDKRVNMITPALLQRFPDALSMSLASPEEIFPFIRIIPNKTIFIILNWL